MSLFPLGSHSLSAESGKVLPISKSWFGPKRWSYLHSQRTALLQIWPPSLRALVLCVTWSDQNKAVKVSQVLEVTILCCLCGVRVEWLVIPSMVSSVKSQHNDYTHLFPEGCWMAQVEKMRKCFQAKNFPSHFFSLTVVSGDQEGPSSGLSQLVSLCFLGVGFLLDVLLWIMETWGSLKREI